MKCPFTVILVSIASEIMEPAVFLLKESHHWLLKRKEKVTILLIEYFRLYVILNLYSISGVFSWEVYMGCFPWSVTGQVESSRPHYGIMPVHYEFWSSMKRRNERPDSCFEPYALTSTTRVGCCFLSFFFQESAERIDALTISLSYRTARRWWARTDTSVKLFCCVWSPAVLF